MKILRRMIQKSNTLDNFLPNIGPTENHTDGLWSANDIYPAEIVVDLHDNKVWVGFSGTTKKFVMDGDDINLTNYYTKTQTDENFLSASTSFYTQNECNNNFLSATTSFYTQAQANANFLSATTSFYTQTEANNLFVKLSGDSLIDGNLTLVGNLYVSGTTTYVNTRDMNVADNLIVINSGETGSGVSKGEAGIIVDRGTSIDYGFFFDELTDTFRIGESGSTQAVATRENNPISGGIAVWNSSEYRFDTISSNSFLSSGTSFYTQAEANANFLSGNTSYLRAVNDPLAGTLLGSGTTTTILDFNTEPVKEYVMTGDTTFTFSNLIIGKSIVLILSGNYTPTLPTEFSKVSGTYSGSKTNYINMICLKSNLVIGSITNV